MLVLQIGGIYELAVEIGSSITIYIQSFIKIGSAFNGCWGGYSYRHTEKRVS
jgi:hypothetical protein